MGAGVWGRGAWWDGASVGMNGVVSGGRMRWRRGEVCLTVKKEMDYHEGDRVLKVSGEKTRAMKMTWQK